MEVERTEGPHDRLTRMCDAALRAYEEHPEHGEQDRCIIFMDDGEEGGLVISGYDEDTEAMANLLRHLQAMFAASGMKLDLMSLDDDGVNRVEG